MKMNCDIANKMIRQLKEDERALLRQESETSMYTYLAGEEPERPEYDFEKTAASLRAIEDKIVTIKHAVNVFNTTKVLPQSGLTIDAALVKMAMLNAEKGKLAGMRVAQPKTRATTMRGVSEYTVRNYEADVVEARYRKVSDELTQLQQELNIANLTDTFEVDIDA